MFAIATDFSCQLHDSPPKSRSLIITGELVFSLSFLCVHTPSRPDPTQSAPPENKAINLKFIKIVK